MFHAEIAEWSNDLRISFRTKPGECDRPIGQTGRRKLYRDNSRNALAVWMAASGCADELQVVRLVGDLPMPKSTLDSALFQEEYAGHLVPVFPHQPDTVLEHRTF